MRKTDIGQRKAAGNLKIKIIAAGFEGPTPSVFVGAAGLLSFKRFVK